MANQSATGLRRIYNATLYSLAGLHAAWCNEEAFRQAVWIAVCGIPLAIWVGDSGVERALLGASLLLVVIGELVNSAIEAVVDRVGAERHLLSGRAKDLGSAVVFLSWGNVVLIWTLIVFD